MCGSATLAMAVSRSSMKVARVTVMAMNQGLMRGWDYWWIEREAERCGWAAKNCGGGERLGHDRGLVRRRVEIGLRRHWMHEETIRSHLECAILLLKRPFGLFLRWPAVQRTGRVRATAGDEGLDLRTWGQQCCAPT